MPTFYETTIRQWKADAQVRAEFRDLATYAAYREHQHARQTGQTVADLRAETADVADYVRKIEGGANPLTPAEREAVDGYAKQWNASGDIRAEFRSFEIFAAFSRARAAGRIKHHGGRR